jgi:flagellar secretion chaperone FliS
MSINTYEENQILSASPVELVRILYAAAVRSVREARDHLRTGDIVSRSREISRAQMILLELAGSVDRSKGKDFADRLLELYDYMLARLAEANTGQKDAPLAEVSALLSTLHEGWSICSAAESAESALAAR